VLKYARRFIKELLLCNTKLATQNIIKFLHDMHIDCYHENIIILLYSIYIKVLTPKKRVAAQNKISCNLEGQLLK
jgi:hypothetical protein